MKVCKCEFWTEKKHDWTEDKKLNPYITETAGFVPLEVQIQKFQQSGQRARFTSDMFDSVDYYDMYMHPDVRVNGNDDLETMNEKFEMQRYLREQIAMQKSKGMQRQSVEQIFKDRDRMMRSEAEQNADLGTKDSPTPPAAGAEDSKS